MYAVRLINHLTDLSEDAAGRRALLVGGGDGEETEAVDQFLCAVTMLLNDTDDESHLSHLTGTFMRVVVMETIWKPEWPFAVQMVQY